MSKGSASEGPLLKEAHIKSGYNAEVIRFAFEGAVRVGLEVALALTIAPEARTTSKLNTLSQAKS